MGPIYSESEAFGVHCATALYKSPYLHYITSRYTVQFWDSCQVIRV